MENIFSPKRFGNLFNKHFREHLRIYLMSLIVFGAVVLAFFIFIVSTSKGRPLATEAQTMVFVFSFWLGIFIFSASIFSDYNHPRSTFTATMLPASIFEKYLLYWTVSLVGFTVLALGVYHLSQAIVIEYLKTQGIESIAFSIWKPAKEGFPVKLLTGFYFLTHSIAFLGAISFRKRTVIVTALVAFAIIAAYMYLNYRASLIALNGNSIPFPFFSANVLVLIKDGLEWAEIKQPNNELWATISLSTLIILFWICAFFKLKERQV